MRAWLGLQGRLLEKFEVHSEKESKEQKIVDASGKRGLVIDSLKAMFKANHVPYLASFVYIRSSEFCCFLLMKPVTGTHVLNSA